MLEYGLPAAPEGHRWYIRASIVGKEYRYLHLEKKNWLGKWATVHKDMISTGKLAGPFEKEVIASAHDILRDINVNFNLPTGEVR